MKLIRKFSAFILITWFVVFISCKKETSCEGCATKNNKPPIAIAGPDQAITLPTDSVSLDGRQSSDPDGTISSYLWTKISGPASFNIISPADSLSKIKTLVAGIYQFELKVTDNGGLTAKDTILINVNDPTQPNNRPPVANAGPDQTITLPTNTVNLDGSASIDPDNNIISYTWTKIAGPFSFDIINSTLVQTPITNFIQGVYQLELKVTDAGGLFSKDTVQIIVNSQVIQNCFQLSLMGHLPSAGGVVHTSAAGNKILFVRYTNNGVVDIYDTTTHGWSTFSNMYSTHAHDYINNAVTLGNKIIYSAPNYSSYTEFNGQLINIYDAVSNTWAVSVIPEGREGYKKAVVGNRVFYIGGRTNDSLLAKRIDVYDAITNAWSTINFPEARSGMCIVSLGNKIFFAGGYMARYDSLVLACDDYGNNCVSVPATVTTDRVDILDVASNMWSVARLTEPRGDITAAVVGNKIVFARGDNNSGNYSARSDVYDAVSDTWSSANMGAIGNPVVCAYSAGNKVLVTYLVSNRVDIYDATTNSWSIVQMPQQLMCSEQERMKGVVSGNKIIFHTIFTNDSDSRSVNIYDASTNTWCHELLNKSHVRAGVISYGGRIYIAGGFTQSNCCTNDTLLDTVWFLSL